MQDEPPRYELKNLNMSSNSQSSLRKSAIAPSEASSSLPPTSTQSDRSRDDRTRRTSSRTNPDDDHGLDAIVERLADRLGVRDEMLPRYDEEMQREVRTTKGSGS